MMSGTCSKNIVYMQLAYCSMYCAYTYCQPLLLQ